MTDDAKRRTVLFYRPIQIRFSTTKYGSKLNVRILIISAQFLCSRFVPWAPYLKPISGHIGRRSLHLQFKIGSFVFRTTAHRCDLAQREHIAVKNITCPKCGYKNSKDHFITRETPHPFLDRTMPGEKIQDVTP